MKAIVYDISGTKKNEITLPEIFETRIREDIALKYYEMSKFYAPHSPSALAGRRHSASGTISHRRHEWKGHYGKGIARVPRKAIWRRGEQFYWIGAEVNTTRGGRAVHTPKVVRRPLKINEKEQIIAVHSALAATANENYVARRYERLHDAKIAVPLIIALPADSLKTKQLIEFLRNVLGDNYHVALQHKSIRAGKGKLRGRTYKSNAGLLLIKSAKEKIFLKGIDVRAANEVSIADIYPLGRLTLYTEHALKELR